MDVIESFELGRLLLVVACITAGAVPTETEGGLLGCRIGHTPVVGATFEVDTLVVEAGCACGGVLAASIVVLVENEIFLMRVKVKQCIQHGFYLRTYFGLIAFSRSKETLDVEGFRAALLHVADSLAGAVEGGVS